MNCIETQKKLDTYLDGDLSSKDKRPFDKHLEQCVSCSHKIEEVRTTRQRLSMLSYESPSYGFEERVFQNVRQHYAKKPSNNRFVAGFAGAIAASFLIWVTTVVFFSSESVPQAQIVSVAMNQVQTIRLMLDSENDVEQVTLSLGLPDNIRLKGYEGKDKVVWQASLSKGNNVLTLPIKAIAYGQGNLTARIQYGNKSKQFNILVKTFKENIQGDVFFDLIKKPKLV